MRVRRERELRVPPAQAWEVVGDPYRLADYWPRVERIESVDAGGFTEVYRTAKGRAVRADFRIAALEDEQELRVVQQLEGTPFERIFSDSSKRMLLAPSAAGTLVALELDQTAAKMAKLGSFMVRKAMGKQLDEALDALAALLEAR